MKIKFVMLLLLMLSITSVIAKEVPFSDKNGEFLVTACQEALEIYKNRDERNFMAAQMTSASEAIRAGYCIGYLQQYLKHTPRCYGEYSYNSHPNNWFVLAQRIASLPFARVEKSNSALLLEKAYCDAN